MANYICATCGVQFAEMDGPPEHCLISGDILQVVSDRRYVSFMYSYPDLIPLPASAVRRIVAAVEPFQFDRIYGGWWDRVVATDAKAGVAHSAERYTAAIEG